MFCESGFRFMSEWEWDPGWVWMKENKFMEWMQGEDGGQVCCMGYGESILIREERIDKILG